MTDIRWEDPPPPVQRGGRNLVWWPRLEPLMGQPKRWALIALKPSADTAASFAANLRARQIRIPPGQWEFASRTVDGEHRVYGRYLGPDETGGGS